MKIGKQFGMEFSSTGPVKSTAYPPAARTAVVVPVAHVVQPTTALARFQGEIGSAIKADALAVLQINVKPVTTREEAAVLADKRAQVKTILKDIEARRKLIVEPLKKEAAAVDAEARTWAEPVKVWDKRAETVLLAFQRLDADRARRAEEAAQEALRAAAEAQHAAEQAGDQEAVEAASVAIMHAEAQPLAEPVKGFKTDHGSQSIRRRWTVEVVNPEDVPPVYLVPDLRKLQAAVDAGARDIPGCNIAEQESMPVRTRS